MSVRARFGDMLKQKDLFGVGSYSPKGTTKRLTAGEELWIV